MTTNKKVKTEKPQRVPVGGMRDILTVYGKDPDYVYYFVKDVQEDGSRIARFIRGGWELTRPDAHTNIVVGQETVYRTKQGESIVRYPAGGGEYHYLMQIRKEWYDEDQLAKQRAIDDTESSLRGKRSHNDNEDGQYGEIKITRS